MSDLVKDAYRKAGVSGVGQPMTADQLDEGISELNLILDHLYAMNSVQTTVSTRVNLAGAPSYTIGVAPVDPLATQPDIVVPVLPLTINQIALLGQGVRTIVIPIDADTYYSRELDTLNQPLPMAYYYERSNPFGVINFYEGAPSGDIEIVYKAALVDVTSNTDYDTFPRALKPYLVTELAYKIAESNGFESQSLKMQSNNFFNAWQNASYQGQPAVGTTQGTRYNIYSDEGE